MNIKKVVAAALILSSMTAISKVIGRKMLSMSLPTGILYTVFLTRSLIRTEL